MRHTKKYKAAILALQNLDPDRRPAKQDHEAVYDALAREGLCWDPMAGQWKKTQRPVNSQGVEQVSIFTAPDGSPTGVFRIRVMAHPDLVERITTFIADQFTVLEPPGKIYPNHKGPGARQYVTLVFQGAQLRPLRGRAARRSLAIDLDEEDEGEDSEGVE